MGIIVVWISYGSFTWQFGRFTAVVRFEILVNILLNTDFIG